MNFHEHERKRERGDTFIHPPSPSSPSSHSCHPYSSPPLHPVCQVQWACGYLHEVRLCHTKKCDIDITACTCIFQQSTCYRGVNEHGYVCVYDTKHTHTHTQMLISLPFPPFHFLSCHSEWALHKYAHIVYMQECSHLCMRAHGSTCTCIFTILKVGENSAELKKSCVYFSICQAFALLSGVGLILSEWHLLRMSTLNKPFYNQGEMCRGEQKFVKNLFTVSKGILYIRGCSNCSPDMVLSGWLPQNTN